MLPCRRTRSTRSRASRDVDDDDLARHARRALDAGDRRLSAAAREAVERADLAYVSAASGWEVALKLGTGKVRLEVPFDDIVVRNGFTELGVTLRHARQLAAVPMRHRDPFDRMLVAQAMVEGATLVSRDSAVGGYGVPIVW